MSDRQSFPILWRDAVYATDRRVLSWRGKVVAGPISVGMDLRGGGIWPSIDRLAEEASISRRTVHKGLAELREAGFLTVEKEGGGRHRPTIYRAALPDETVHHVHRFASKRVHVRHENSAPRAPESAQESAHLLRRTGVRSKERERTHLRALPNNTKQRDNPWEGIDVDAYDHGTGGEYEVDLDAYDRS